MSNIKEETSLARKQVFDAIKTLGNVSSYDIAELLSMSYPKVTSFLLDLTSANMVTRVKRPVPGHMHPVQHYSTDLAEFRWGVREREMVKIANARAALAATARKSEAKTKPVATARPERVEIAISPAVREFVQTQQPISPLAQALASRGWQDKATDPVHDPVKAILHQIEGMSYRDVKVLKFKLEEMFA